MTAMKRIAIATAILALCLGSGGAPFLAGPTERASGSPERRAAEDDSIRRARALIDEKRYDEAQPILEEAL